MLGISIDPPGANKAFREKFAFPYDLLSDQTKAASISYGAAEADSTRTRRVSVLIGPNGAVVKAYDTVKPAEHPDQVLADLKALGK